MFACLSRLGDASGKSTNLLWRAAVARNFSGHADHVFDEMLQRDLSSLNSQLSSYLRGGNPDGTLGLFVNMHRASPVLTSHTFTPVLGACALSSYPKTGRQVHALMIKQGAETGTISKTALIDMYSKHGSLADSVAVFDTVEDKDVVSWNALLSGFLRNGKGKEALGVFAAMCRDKVAISEFTLCSVVKTCASLKILQQGKQVHAVVVVTGRDLVVLGTSIISFYSSVGLMSEAMKVYFGLNVRTDEAMLNSLVSGCIRNRNYKDALSLMSRRRPNARVLVSSLASCSDNSDLWIGKQIHCVALRNGFLSDSKLCNGLMDMYGKCGQIAQARAVFRAITSKTVVSWTSMIDAYGVNGDGVKALETFREMCEEGSGVLPNSVTFLVVLSACAHAGLVEEGKECFGMMKDKYGLLPGTEIGQPINAQVAQRVISQLVTLASIDDKSDILIYLNCPGGSTYSVLAIYDCMSWIKPKVGTVAFGVAASQGALLLAGGEKGMRYAMPNTRVMIHQPQTGCGGHVEDVRRQVNEAIEARQKIDRMYAAFTGQTLETVQQYTERDRFLSASEALEFGLIDGLLETEY